MVTIPMIGSMIGSVIGKGGITIGITIAGIRTKGFGRGQGRDADFRLDE